MLLTPENFERGFLIDEELMAGISPVPGGSGSYQAYVLRHTTGECLGTKTFDRLEDALAALNAVPRPWKYERLGGCGGGACGKAGAGCAGGSCPAAGKASCACGPLADSSGP